MTEQAPPPTMYLTVKEAAHELRRQPYTIRHWIKLGLLPATRIGGSILIKRSTLDELPATRGPLPDEDSP